MRKYVLIFLALFVACSGQEKKEDKTEQAKIMPKPAVEKKVEYARTEAGNPIVQVKTTMGDFEIEVFADSCPVHGNNFLQLVEDEYYDDNIFHRVIPNFMIQTGDPTGTGGGNPGYSLEPEPVKYKNKRSYIAMAQSAKEINGSQFYILVADSPHLDDKFPCFARVISGMDVVDAISKVKTKNERPVVPVKIITARPKPVETPADTLTEKSPS
jgi:cyclophilin family peptidyl-prolyl cis-trans isomerase